MNPLFSIIIGTGRPSIGSLIGLPDTHLFLLTMQSLEKQTERNFELVIVDSIGSKRDLHAEIEGLGMWSFPWKVVTPSSWWLDRGYWALQNAFNTGFRHSTGQYVYFCGDCCEFPKRSFWHAQLLINAGYVPSFLFVYRRAGFLIRQTNGTQSEALFRTVHAAKIGGGWDDGIVRDSRWTFVESHGGFADKSETKWDMMYGYCCVPREDFIYVNGYDENLDGDKALGDVELGSRLEMAGRWKMALTQNLYVYENSHFGLAASFNNCQPPGTAFPAIRSNYDLIHLLRRKKQWRANSIPLSEEDCLKVIRSQVMKLAGWPQYRVEPDEVGYNAQRHWIENQPVFEL